VWPVCRHFVFPEFLLASGQHLLIQEYVRLLHGWCEWNNCSRKFLLGSALLDMGEPYKAYDLLVQAAKGITTDDFMASKLVPSADNLSEQQLLVLYYLKVWLVGVSEVSHLYSETSIHYFPVCCLPASVVCLTLRRLMSYIYMEHPFLMFLDHTQ